MSCRRQLVEECRPAGADPGAERLAAELTGRLARSALFVVAGFAEQLSWTLFRPDRREYGEGLSGDAFLHARGAVVAAGRTACEDVMRDPADFVPYAAGHIRAEGLLSVPDRTVRTHHRRAVGAHHPLLLRVVLEHRGLGRLNAACRSGRGQKMPWPGVRIPCGS